MGAVRTVRAVTFHRYGPPDVLRLEEVAKPVPTADQVLVRVVATTTTRSDCGLRSAEYFVARLFTGLFRPKRASIGLEFAGEVEAVGDDVTGFQAGQRVFGICNGGNAEYVCVAESDPIATIPRHDELRRGRRGGRRCTQRVLPAAERRARVGATDRRVRRLRLDRRGLRAVAKHQGAYVTAVCNTKNLELMRRWAPTRSSTTPRPTSPRGDRCTT